MLKSGPGPSQSATGAKSGKKRLSLREQSAKAGNADGDRSWQVLVVDDEADVHEMTRLLLRDLRFKDRSFEVISAFSATQARMILAERPDIPVMLLDVVMETPNAGLELVRHVRDEMGNHRIAIVLRTGQPGEAPERDVMTAYEINDYRGKTDLTAQKLFTALVGGLRSWINLTTIDSLNAGLEARVRERTAELEQAKRFAENLVDLLPHPVWYKDAERRLKMYNRAFKDLFSLPAAGAAMPTELAVADHHCDDVVLGEGGGDMAFEIAIELAEGAKTFLVTKGRIDDGESGLAGTVGVINDITERKRMERQLRTLATIDDLTGALNRRAFFAAAAQELDRAVRYGNPVTVIMFDMDHFKQINDRHGHAVGDQALRLAVAALRRSLREVDIVGRIGGEEFALLLPETPLAGALEVAERLRQAVEAVAIPLPLDHGGQLRVTGSLGVAERRADETQVDHVLARADAALYAAKAAGRNRVAGS